LLHGDDDSDDDPEGVPRPPPELVAWCVDHHANGI
jgi:hypothetical protein